MTILPAVLFFLAGIFGGIFIARKALGASLYDVCKGLGLVK